ncbi:MAG: peptidoglycan synthetase [Reichenbachiella sp.]
MNNNFQKVHIIATGGAVMSSLAIALKEKGIEVTGSDDKIYDPARTNLQKNGLLPDKEGWDAKKINTSLDAVIVGMHAKNDNPELQKATELELPILSYPEFIRSQSENKQRVVIAGSHGKTTITGIIIHVLNYWKRSFDYLVGAKIKGIENTIQLTDAPLIIIEGDEYFTSPLDQTPKFLKYDHHIALISGTAWDHINVYPTIDSYIEQFENLADKTPKAGSLVFCEHDKMTYVIGNKERDDVKPLPYQTPKYQVKDGIYYLKTEEKDIPVKIFGKHNMQNIEGARNLMSIIGINSAQFYEAIQSFEGAEKRNNLIAENDHCSVYSDFAHAPSKLKATVDAFKELHPKRNLTACFELHTFSSLNKEFLPHYQGKMDKADEAIIYFNKKHLEEKNYLKEISSSDIQSSFKRKDILVFTEKKELENHLVSKSWDNEDLLLMSSGNFDGMKIEQLANKITNKS